VSIKDLQEAVDMEIENIESQKDKYEAIPTKDVVKVLSLVQSELKKCGPTNMSFQEEVSKLTDLRSAIASGKILHTSKHLSALKEVIQSLRAKEINDGDSS